MAEQRRELRKCPSCGKPTYKDNPVCMWCGAEEKVSSGGKKKKKKKGKVGKIVLFVLAVFVVLAIVGAISGDEDSKSNDGGTVDSGSSQDAKSQNDGTSQEKEESWEITYQDSKVYKNSLDEIACYAIVEVENTGEVDLYLDSATFDFEDSNGSLLGTCSGMISSDPDIISPGEKGYFYCNMESVKGDITENSEYTFVPSLKIEKSKNDIVRYDVSDLSISDGGLISPFSIIGRVENNTDEDDGLVWISCIVYREDGTPIAACGTNVTDLEAGQKQSFDLDAVWLSNLDLKLSDIADYKVYACKTQYQF